MLRSSVRSRSSVLSLRSCASHCVSSRTLCVCVCVCLCLCACVCVCVGTRVCGRVQARETGGGGSAHTLVCA